MPAVDRRSFLIAAAGFGAMAIGGCASQAEEATQPPVVTRRSDTDASGSGRHQLGVTSPPPTGGVAAALDIKVAGRAGLERALRTLTERLKLLGQERANSASDAGRLTATVAVGASLFDRRFGLGRLRPEGLTTMPSFPNDALDPDWCHGDLLLQVCAERPSRARAVVRRLLDGTKSLMAVHWSVVVFRPENQVTGQVATTRNLFGFRDGAGNPDPADHALMDKLVWVQPEGHEPAWAAGGTYQVVRLIRFATKLWDAEPVERQEDVFGRHKQTGAPLAGKREDQVPNFAADPDGRITPLDAHIRRANPRTPETEANRILRRSYSYRRGRDATGQSDEGLIFVCFQQDLERGFATIQRRLRGEALERYVLPFGGGYFFVLPTAPPGGYLGQQLLEAAKSARRLVVT
jgi:deferrochelatase/peroxidase EfeB